MESLTTFLEYVQAGTRIYLHPFSEIFGIFGPFCLRKCGGNSKTQPIFEGKRVFSQLLFYGFVLHGLKIMILLKNLVCLLEIACFQ